MQVEKLISSIEEPLFLSKKKNHQLSSREPCLKPTPVILPKRGKGWIICPAPEEPVKELSNF